VQQVCVMSKLHLFQWIDKKVRTSVMYNHFIGSAGSFSRGASAKLMSWFVIFCPTYPGKSLNLKLEIYRPVST